MSITAEQMGVIIREQRKNRGLTQQDLAQAAGVSVQAVSKWEIGQSLPDVTLLPDIADCLGLSLAALFGREEPQAEIVDAAPLFPDDNRLRVAQFFGSRLLKADGQAIDTPPIPLAIEEALKSGLSEDQRRRLVLTVEVLGPAHIQGAVQGDMRVGGQALCAGDIQGNLEALGSVECRGVIQGDASAGGSLTCGGDIQGHASAGGHLECRGDIQGHASAGAALTCDGDIQGNASADGNLTCGGDINGDASAGADLNCGGGIGGDMRPRRR